MDIPTACTALAANLAIVAAYVAAHVIPPPWDDDDTDGEPVSTDE